jgi:VIT1/CCC1 family predicted Fe2+/Mn2+ transporter
MLDGRFTLDFKWLYGQDRDQYFALRSLVQESYQGELRIVDEATEVLRQVLAKKNGEETSPEYGNRFNSEEWIKWHLNSSQTIVRIIEDYENRSREAVKKIHDVAYNTGVKILTTAEYERALLDPQHHPEVLPMEPYSEVVIRVERSKEEYMAQEKHEEHKTQRLNTILSYTFGVVFITAILVLVLVFNNLNATQVRVFGVILALAAGGVGTTISGMLNVNMKLGTRLVIGATGALAVFVIVYFFPPALGKQ